MAHRDEQYPCFRRQHARGILRAARRVGARRGARGSVRRLAVSPPIPGHRVSICYQVSEFGSSMQRLVELVRELVLRHKLFT
jgi:hypothetical protein